MIEVAIFSAGAVVGSLLGPSITRILERRDLFNYIAHCEPVEYLPACILRIARENFVGAVRL